MFFWHDLWLEQGRLIDKLGWTIYQQFGHHFARVADFIEDGIWQLPTTAISTANLEWDSIRNIELPAGSWKDRLIWKPQKSSSFSFKSACAALLDPGQPVSWTQHAVGKFSCTAFHTFHGRLWTSDRMQRMGFRLASRCSLKICCRKWRTFVLPLGLQHIPLESLSSKTPYKLSSALFSVIRICWTSNSFKGKKSSFKFGASSAYEYHMAHMEGEKQASSWRDWNAQTKTIYGNWRIHWYPSQRRWDLLQLNNKGFWRIGTYIRTWLLSLWGMWNGLAQTYHGSS